MKAAAKITGAFAAVAGMVFLTVYALTLFVTFDPAAAWIAAGANAIGVLALPGLVLVTAGIFTIARALKS